MSNFNYRDCHLTYFLEGMGGWFQDELERAITIATASIEVYCKFAITSTITDLDDDNLGNPNVSIALRGFYCVFIFKTDEDRTLFKLTVNNTCDFKQRVLEVLSPRTLAR